MAESNPLQDAQNTRDNLNPTDTNQDYILKRTSEDIFIEELPTQLLFRDTSGDTIWGAFNWGEANWDNSYTNTLSAIRVINPNNIFRDYFRDTDFFDASNSTCSVSTTWNRIVFSGAQTFQSKSVFLNSQNIIKGKVYIDTSFVSNSTSITFQMTATGGTSWESVTNNTWHTFGSIGTDLRYRITSTANASIFINNYLGISKPIEVKYEISD